MTRRILSRIAARYRPVAVAVLLLAFFFRIHDITARSLWFDEAVEFFTATVPLSHLPQAVTAANYQPPLMALLLNGWVRIDIAPLWLRLLPVVFSMLTVAGLMMWARWRFGRITSLVAGLLIAVMPTEIYYAQDVGEYALLICALTWALLFLDRAQTRGGWRAWIGWALCAVAALYTHYGAVIVVAPTAALVLLTHAVRRQWTFVGRQLGAGIAAVAAVTPLALYFLPSQSRRIAESGMGEPWVSLSAELARLPNAVVDTFAYNLSGWPLSDIGRTASIIVLAVASLALLAAVRRMPLWLAGWLGASFLLYFVLVRAGLYVGIYGLRYGLIFTPLFVLLLAAAIGALLGGRLAWLGGAVLVLLLGVQLYASPSPSFSQQVRSARSWQPMEQLEPAMSFWLASRSAEEPTYVYYGAVPAFMYYAQVLGLSDALWHTEVRPADACGELCDAYRVTLGPWARQLSAEARAAHVVEHTGGGSPDAFWLLLSHTPTDEVATLLEALGSEYAVAASQVLDDAAVYRLVRVPPN